MFQRLLKFTSHRCEHIAKLFMLVITNLVL